MSRGAVLWRPTLAGLAAARGPDPDAMAGANTHALVLRSLDQRSGRAIDLGCGQGALTLELARRGFDVCAVDICAEQFDAKDLPNVHFCLADLNAELPHPANLFDVVCAIEVIEHLENPRHFLRECRRIMRHDGVLVLSTPNVVSMASHLNFLFRGCFIYFSQREYAGNHHISPMRLQDLRNVFDEIGLRVLAVDYNVGKLPIPKLRHWLPMRAKPLRNVWLGENLIVWAAKKQA